ncbi:uncharacterized protein LOC134983037 isoform X2 [Pseudophryne corroboree]|uniref:uncharacterized protein LOC134983037 isoform X2 n=1 Tax=Pseudophryne corroboree TaxID=495146 RepID=UPI003081E0D6
MIRSGLLILLTRCALCWAQTQIKYAVTGSDVTLQAGLSGTPKEISWTFNGNKIVDLHVSYPPDFYSNWAERVEADLTSGRLTIRNASAEDSGTYNADVIVTLSVITPTTFSLRVLDGAVKPNITFSSVGNNFTLQCICRTPGVTYEWRNSTNAVVSKGQNYTVTRDPGAEEETVTCVVRNPASENNETYTFPPIAGNSRGHVIGWIFAGICVVGIGIGIFLVYYFSKKKRGAPNRVENGERAQQGEGPREDGKRDEQPQERNPMLGGDDDGMNRDIPGQDAQTNTKDSTDF